MDIGYLLFDGVKCSFVRKGLNYCIIPCDEKQHISSAGKYNVTYKIDYECAGYRYCASIVETHINGAAGLELVAEYVIKIIPDHKITGLMIMGDEIDEFFSPLDYYFKLVSAGEYSKKELLYSSDTVAQYEFTYNGKRTSVKVIYGDVLSWGVISDLKIHPKLELSFEETDDIDFMVNIVKIITKFLQIVRHQKKVNIKTLKLIDDGNQIVGDIILSEYSRDTNRHTHCEPSFVYFNEGISDLLQIVADENDLPIEHFPNQSFDIDEYSGQRFAAIFAAFEYECKRGEMKNITTADTAATIEIRDRVLAKISEINATEANDRDFVFAIKQKIKSYGTEMGQKQKVKVAYEYAKDCLEHSVKYLSFHNKGIDAVLKQIADLRGKTVHSEIGKSFTKEEEECIRFMDVLQYSLLLKRTSLQQHDIEIILGGLFGCNNVRIEDIMKNST